MSLRLLLCMNESRPAPRRQPEVAFARRPCHSDLHGRAWQRRMTSWSFKMNQSTKSKACVKDRAETRLLLLSAGDCLDCFEMPPVIWSRHDLDAVRQPENVILAETRACMHVQCSCTFHRLQEESRLDAVMIAHREERAMGFLRKCSPAHASVCLSLSFVAQTATYWLLLFAATFGGQCSSFLQVFTRRTSTRIHDIKISCCTLRIFHIDLREALILRFPDTSLPH